MSNNVSRDDIVRVLTSTFNARSEEERLAAERSLFAWEQQPNFVASLLSLCTQHNDVPVPVRQAASLRVKHSCIRRWYGEKALGEVDKTQIRANLVLVTLAEPSGVVRAQLLEVIASLTKQEWRSARWSQLLPQLLEAQASSAARGDEEALARVLEAMQAVFAALADVEEDLAHGDRETDAQAQSLSKLAQELLPPVGAFVKQLLQAQHMPSQAALRSCCAALHCVRHALRGRWLRECFVQHQCAMLERWLQLVQGVLTQRAALPLNDMSSLLADCQETALRLLAQLWRNFGRGDVADDFAVRWRGHYALPIVEWCVMPLVREYAEGVVFVHMAHPSAASLDRATAARHALALAQQRKTHAPQALLSRRALLCLFELLDLAVQAGEVYSQALRPQLQTLLRAAAARALAPTVADAALLAADADAFGRAHALAAFHEWRDPRAAAQRFVVNLVRIRTRDTLGLVLNWLDGTLRRCGEVVARDSQAALEKEAALRLVGALAAVLMSAEQRVGGDGAAQARQLGDFARFVIAQAALPELSAAAAQSASSAPFVRARALWTIAQLSRLRMPASLSEQVVLGVAASLADPAPFVRLEAAKTVAALTLHCEEGTRHAGVLLPLLRPHLPVLLQRLLQLVQDMQGAGASRLAVSVLARLADLLGEEMIPYAPELLRRLTLLFRHSFADSSQQQRAYECLRAMCEIVRACALSVPSAGGIKSLAVQLAPLLRALFSAARDDFLQDALALLEALSCRPVASRAALPTEVWQLLPLAVAAWQRSFAAAQLRRQQSQEEAHDDASLRTLAWVLHNVMQFGDGTFAQFELAAQQSESNKAEARRNPVALVYAVASSVLDGRASSDDYVIAGLLLQQLLSTQATQGRLQRWMPLVVGKAMRRLALANQADAETVRAEAGRAEQARLGVRVAMLGVLACAAHHDAAHLCAVLEQFQWTATCLSAWLWHLPHMPWQARSTACHGLAALLRVPPAQLPPSVQSHVPALAALLANVVLEIGGDSPDFDATDVDEEEQEGVPSHGGDEAMNEALDAALTGGAPCSLAPLLDGDLFDVPHNEDFDGTDDDWQSVARSGLAGDGDGGALMDENDYVTEYAPFRDSDLILYCSGSFAALAQHSGDKYNAWRAQIGAEKLQRLEVLAQDAARAQSRFLERKQRREHMLQQRLQQLSV